MAAAHASCQPRNGAAGAVLASSYAETLRGWDMPVTRALVAKRWGHCPVATLAAASLLLIMPPPMCTFCFRAFTFCFFLF